MEGGSVQPTLFAVVRGEVQGVGFRAFVAREAERLGLAGTVRNLSDGSVEVHAAGPPPQIEKLIALLHKGPRFSSVRAVEIQWIAKAPRTQGFDIVG